MSDIYTVKQLDPRIDVSAPSAFVCVEGPENITYQSIPASQIESTQGFNFQITPPSLTSGVNRIMNLRLTGRITITGTNFNAAGAQHYIAFKSWPLHRFISSISAQAGTVTKTTANVNRIISALSKAGNSVDSMNFVQSGTNTAPDVNLSYGDSLLSLSNPFRPPVDRLEGASCGRQTGIRSITVGATTIVVDFELVEPLLCSPFLANNRQSKFIYGLPQLNITGVYTPSPANMLSLFLTGGAQTYTGTSIAITNTTLDISFVTPPAHIARLLSVTDKPQIYSATHFELYSNTQADLAPGVSAQYNFPAIQMQQVPKCLIVWASYPEATFTSSTAATYADIYLPVSALSITYANKTLFQGMTQMQLYDMSQRAGGLATYSEFICEQSRSPTGAKIGRGNGAPLIIPAAELGLTEGLCAGSSLYSTLSGQITVSNPLDAQLNQAAQTIKPLLNVMVVFDAMIKTLAGQTSYQIISLGQDKVLASPEVSLRESLDHAGAVRSGLMMGGNWFSDFTSGFKKGFDETMKIGLPLAKMAMGAGSVVGGGAVMQKKNAGRYL